MTDLPSYELVQRFLHEAGFPIADPNDEMVFPEAKFMKLASRLIQHGADQELEACCEWLVNKLTFREDGIRFAGELRSARRPKPPSLKEKALTQLTQLVVDLDRAGMRQRASILEGPIRRALEALPND